MTKIPMDKTTNNHIGCGTCYWWCCEAHECTNSIPCLLYNQWAGTKGDIKK